jgi:hypothetical protein
MALRLKLMKGREMFNKKPEIHYHSHEVNRNETVTSTTTVTENKAPTDESLRLLDEMQKKAADRIIDKHFVKLKDTPFEGFVIQMHMDDYLRGVHYCVMFKLSGKEFKFYYEADKYETNQEYLIKAISDGLSEVMQKELFKVFIESKQVR